MFGLNGCCRVKKMAQARRVGAIAVSIKPIPKPVDKREREHGRIGLHRLEQGHNRGVGIPSTDRGVDCRPAVGRKPRADSVGELPGQLRLGPILHSDIVSHSARARDVRGGHTVLSAAIVPSKSARTLSGLALLLKSHSVVAGP